MRQFTRKRATIYVCDHCEKRFESRNNATTHENESCLLNPARKTCDTCRHNNDDECASSRWLKSIGDPNPRRFQENCNYHERRDAIAD